MATDVAVIGLGAMGSSALHHLARRGLRVVGFEQFAPAHDRGSSHGETRIIRLGYFEHPSYVPLVRAALRLWRALEKDSGEPLLRVTGIMEMGRPDGALAAGTLRSARLHGLTHEVLDAASLMRRFPAFRLPADFIGVVQPEGGILAVEPAIKAQLALAVAAGAELHTNEFVRALEPIASGMRVVTDRGATEAGQAIITAGPWLARLLPDFPVALRVTRQVFGWFEPAEPAIFVPGRCPVFLVEDPSGVFYGFPAETGRGLKFARHHHQDETVDPSLPMRPAGDADEAILRTGLAAYAPGANGRLVDARTCLYTITPDGDFILDRLPGMPAIIVASPCSGHGFKFAPLIGEILADLATQDHTGHDISRFRLSRFQ